MRLKELACALGLAEPKGDFVVVGINTLRDAKANELSFFDNPKYLADLKKTKAGAVLIAPNYQKELPQGVEPLVTDEPYLMLALASSYFAKEPLEQVGEESKIAPSALIAPSVYVGKGAKIGENVKILPGSFIGDYVVIGDGTVIHPNVTIYRECTIGKNCIIHAGAVIGSDGFGFAHTKDGRHIKIYQNGNVVVEDEVEIGANTTIDRAAFGSTIIKKGVKIDNLVQIAHNCVIGEFSIIVSQTGISGSTTLGRNVVMGGQSATAGHLKIGDFATVAARGGVTKSIEGKKIYSGFPLMEHNKWLRLQAKITQLLKGGR